MVSVAVTVGVVADSMGIMFGVQSIRDTRGRVGAKWRCAYDDMDVLFFVLA